MLQDNVEGYRKEISSLREKGQKMGAVAQKHEQAVNTLTQELCTANEKINMAEVSCVCVEVCAHLRAHICMMV